MPDNVRILTDPNAIRRYQLRVVISAIKLESRGIQVSKRGRVKALWAKRFGLSARAKPEEIIARLEAEIKDLEQQATHIGG
jgi:hypothetical protein